MFCYFFFFSSRRRHTRCSRDWSSDVCSSDLQHSVVAEAYLTLAHGYAERVGDYRMLGNVWSLLGILSWKQGDLQRARDFYTRAKPLRERSGDVVGFAVDQTNLGAVAACMGDFAEARRAWEAALPAARR